MAHFNSPVVIPGVIPGMILVATFIGLATITEVATAAEQYSVPQDYTAVYKVLRNEKELAAVTISLSHQQDVWTLHGYSHDTRGFAEFLRIKGTQTTTGKWHDGRFRPDNYELSFSLIGFKTNWQALFDWQTGIVETTGKQGKSRLPMESYANDPFSLSLNLRYQLAKNLSAPPVSSPGDGVIDIKVVDEDEIENHQYRFDPQGRTNTGLGCLDTTLVRRVRENRKRLSLGWYAQDHQFIPVRMQHKSKKGTNLELLIVSLEIDGTEIQPTAPCPSIAG